MRAALLGVLILSGMMSLAARASHYSLNCSNPKGTVTYNVLGPVIKLHPEFDSSRCVKSSQLATEEQ